jgi:threonyl-tRNA synthetase
MAQSKDKVQALRHSLAHLLAAAVLDLYPEAKNSIGPAIENGFYQDFEIPDSISEEDLPKIEKKMREILKTWDSFEKREVNAEEARAEFSWNPYKLELIEELVANKTPITFYTSGSFIDLCRGGHMDDAKQINPNAFKLQKVSGAYWRGDQTKQQLQRVYGTAFLTENEFKAHLAQLEEAKKRDHRKLGQELDLFTFSDLVGAGLPLFTPRGTILRDQLLGFSEELQRNAGYEKVFIPHITKQELYETSGHWDKFGDELFLVKSQETTDKFVLKPMNCPHHTQIYASRPRSYRELPIRYMESTVQYRDEKKGELNGLSRVRSISIDDAHVFCRLDQIEEEFTIIMRMIKDMYSVFDMQFKARLSFRDDSSGYLGDKAVWERAQSTIEQVAQKLELDYFVAEGEAAFYGPKIDIMVTDALGREWQCATEQLDFVQPERFALEYVAEDGKIERPVMIHKALLGSFERFLSVYIEHTAGKFSVWLAPEQIRLITVNQEQKTMAFADAVAEQGKKLGLRVGVDNSNESVGKKIRTAELMKVPYTIVIGEKELENGQVTPRVRSDMEVKESHEAHEIPEFLKTVANEAKSRVTKTSL